MKQITEYLTTKVSKLKIKATDKTIHKIVKEEMDKYGHDCDLNYVDVSEVTCMDSLFSCYENDLGELYSDLNPNISEWDVSNVINMKFIFNGCKRFNCSINEWNVRNVKNTRAMFNECNSFNQDLSEWDVNNVEDMCSMFSECSSFNQDLSNWDVSNVKNMGYMFYKCRNFNKDLSSWNVSKVKWRYLMFDDCPIQEKYKPHFIK